MALPRAHDWARSAGCNPYSERMRRPVIVALVVFALAVLAAGRWTYVSHHRDPGTGSCKSSRHDYTAAIQDAARIERQTIPDTRGLTGDALAKAPWQSGTPAYDKAALTKAGQAAARARFGANVVREDHRCFTVRERARADTQLGILDSPRGR